MTRLLSASLLLFVAIVTQAQNFPGKRDSLYSEVLKEQRIIQVALPEGYKPGGTEKYEVMYILDEGNIRFISSIQQFTEMEGYMPSIILVAIYNVDRNRDFLPTHVPQLPTSGGADKFISFLKDELIPYIDSKYPTNGSNILYGHSFGGVFSTYALMTEPKLFDYYIAVDPSYWWDNEVMNKMAPEKFARPLPSRKSIYISGREGEGFTNMGLPGMDSVLRSGVSKDLNWKMVAYPNETHGSIRLKSIYDGLRFFYDGYSTGPIEFHPMNGIVLKDKPYKIYYFGSSQSVRYSTDGSEPTLASAIMASENSLTNAVKIAAKSIGNYHLNNKVTHGEFVLGKPLPPGPKPKNVKSGGLNYKYYEGDWDKLPDFMKLKPLSSGVTNKDFDLNKLSRPENFACRFEGFIEIQLEGYYIFVLDSDDGSRFFLGDKLLIDHDGLHASGKPKTFMVPLSKGFYPVRIEYFQKGGGANLNLMYVLPHEKNPQPIPIPGEVLYSK